MSISIDQLRRELGGRCGVRPERIAPDSDLVRELGIAGSDGCELVEYLAGKYCLDLSYIDWGVDSGADSGDPVGRFCAWLFASCSTAFSVRDLETVLNRAQPAEAVGK